MLFLNAIRRRYLPKAAPIFKRVVLPVFIIVLIMHTYFTPSKEEIKSPDNPIIIPGEALDPILQKVEIPNKSRLHFKDHRNNGAKNVLPQPSHKAPKPSPPLPPPIDSDVPPRLSTSWSMAKANIPDSNKVRFKGHAITEDTITLTLMSSADKVFMSINKKEIYRSIEKRGVHVVVLNQYSGRVMSRRIFDTFLEGVEKDLVDFVDDVTDGRILVLAVCDDMSKGLSWRGRNLLKELGSRWADQISFRDMWAIATRKGGLKIAETFSNVATADTGYEWGGPIFMRTDFDLEERPVECPWSEEGKSGVRRKFCRRYEGYGKLCSCDIAKLEEVFKPMDKRVNQELRHHPLYKDLVTVVLATNRAHYIYRLLKSLIEAPGCNRNRIVLYTDKPNKEVQLLSELFDVIVMATGVTGNTTSTRLRHKTQEVFRDLFDIQFPSSTIIGSKASPSTSKLTANHVFLLEDDFTVAVDVFKYLYSTSSLFIKDPSILGISAFNYYGSRDVASSLTASYRTTDPHGIALLLPKRTAKEVLLPSWPKVEESYEWWHGLSVTTNAKKGHILHPEVPRAKHSSYVGEIIQGIVQRDFFDLHLLSTSLDYEIGEQLLNSLTKEKYEENLISVINTSEVTQFDFCKFDLEFKHNPLVMFISFDGKNEDHFNYVMKCLSTWYAYPVGGYHDVWQMHYHGHLLTIVAVPKSKFSYLSLSPAKVVTAPPNTNVTKKGNVNEL